eukprot:TRINITY_DN387_c0_g1_i2.p2 TRINITY_DN387_c0_g1~~TRINITY_DN387_c0_g1_i2.p2  ORF type:complete len:176 (+),score=32.91 TRINITY_DN387_c0_g1_i2:799-1326(+)
MDTVYAYSVYRFLYSPLPRSPTYCVPSPSPPHLSLSLSLSPSTQQLYRDQDMFTLSNSIRCFEGEIDPEAELQKWEALANAYKMECERRGKVAKLTKKKIWLALVAACTVGPDIAKIKAICVSAKKLKQLERLLETYAACGCGVDLKRWPNPNPTSQMKKRRRGKGKGKGKGKRR